MKRWLEGLRRARAGLVTRRAVLAKALAQLVRRVDPRDVAVFGGLAMVARGVSQVYSPASWIIVGLFFMWIALRRKTA